ncbi:MAG: WG repeat-containing protein [Oscillospiraceae bacterium]|nr:WG repeat-containing protein [Oscillospiraceae bacterium]
MHCGNIEKTKTSLGVNAVGTWKARRVFAVALAAIMIVAGAALLSGCGDKGSPQDDGAAATADATATADTAATADAAAAASAGGAGGGAEADGADGVDGVSDVGGANGAEGVSGDGGAAQNAQGAQTTTAAARSSENPAQQRTQTRTPTPAPTPTPTPAPTPAPAPIPVTSTRDTFPRVPLRLSREEYPRVDGSTATIPLSVMLARAVTGMGQAEADSFITHTRTTQSFYNLAFDGADLLIVYEPAESVFTDLEEYNDIDKSSFIMEPIGKDALIFLVNDQNPVQTLNHAQLLAIYTGAVTKWSRLDSVRDMTPAEVIAAALRPPSVLPAKTNAADDEIVAFQRNKTSGSQVMMENLVMEGAQMAEAPNKLVVAEMSGLVESVAEYNNSGNAIGYSVYYYFNNMFNLEGVRALDVDGIPCNNETIRSGEYPYTQSFYAVIRANEPAGSNARKLFDLLTSVDGQALIEAAGYVAQKGTYGGVYSPAVDDGDRPLDTLSTIKRPAAGSPDDVALGGGEAQNIFPIAFGGLHGFINGDGELVVEPIYDAVEMLQVFNGGETVNTVNAPLYYSAIIYKRGANGVPDIENIDYSAVIGPSGEIVHENRDSGSLFYAIDLADNSLSGYRRDIVGHPQFVINGDGSVLTLDTNEYFSMLAGVSVGDSYRWVYNYLDEGYYLIDSAGARINDSIYVSLITYNEDVFIFFPDYKSRDKKLVAINNVGEEVYKFPDDITDVSWLGSSGLFAYSSNEYILVNEMQYNLWGLMDTDYNKLTDPLWTDISPTHSGAAFIVDDRHLANSQERAITLIDRTGKRLTERYYSYIYRSDYRLVQPVSGAPGGAADASSEAGGGQITEYMLGQYTAYDNGSMSDAMEVIDINGNVIFKNSEELQIHWVYGDYAALSLQGDKGNGAVGLKYLGDDADILYSPTNGWLIQPLYDGMQSSIYANFGSNYIIASTHSSERAVAVPVGEGNVVYNLERGEVAFSGDYYFVRFEGYRYTGASHLANTGGGGGVDGDGISDGIGDGAIFYAETASIKGFLNERGEWIVRLSRYDTLDADG